MLAGDLIALRAPRLWDASADDVPHDLVTPSVRRRQRSQSVACDGHAGARVETVRELRELDTETSQRGRERFDYIQKIGDIEASAEGPRGCNTVCPNPLTRSRPRGAEAARLQSEVSGAVGLRVRTR